jgi:hypothetical protein
VSSFRRILSRTITLTSQRWIAPPEVVEDWSDIAASETPRRPRGLRGDVVAGLGRLYGTVSRWQKDGDCGGIAKTKSSNASVISISGGVSEVP